jgi:predicted extracellular nuclease
MALTAGDIAIIGLITNGTPDALSLLTLSPIAAGEAIYFTDSGWTGSGFRGVTATDTNGNEDLIKLTINSPIAAGTVIRSSDSSTNYTWTTSGTIKNGVAGTFAPLALSQSGDQITSLQSNSTDPLLNSFTPIFQVDNTGAFEDATSSTTGSVATGLSAAANTAILLNNATATTAQFNLTTLNGGSKEQWLAAINNPANWVFDSSGALANSSVLVGSGNPNPPPATPITKINSIQGSGSSFNTAFGGVRTIEGIVVGAFQGSTKLDGFYVQEEDADRDNNDSTSEGIFISDPNGLFAGSVGNKVRVTGTVGELTATGSSLTRLGNITSAVNLGASTLPIVTNVNLPVVNSSFLERYEGMLVNIQGANGNLTVTDNYTLARYGQVGLSSDGRIEQFTQANAPSVSGYSAYRSSAANRQIILDDGSISENPNTVTFARSGQSLSATNTLRGGDTVSGLSGILDDRLGGFRVQTSTPVNFLPTNARELTAPAVGGNLKVASFNLLNFFNGNGSGGSFPTARGADTVIEFARQTGKTVQAILGTNADILGYSEMENDGYGSTSAVQTLVNALNASVGAGTYAFVQPPSSLLTGTGRLGGDQITVGFIYKTSAARVAPGTNIAALTTGAFDQGRSQRPALAVTFERLANGTPTTATFTAVSNHFKSKGTSSGGVGDADAGDGQGLSNGSRTRASQELAAWLATNPTGTTDQDYLIMGDLNAYRLEDPLTTLTNAGYTNLFGPESYSYQFDGQWGSLDHALTSASLNNQVTGASKWHINADEPIALDYNTEFKTAGQITSFYNTDPFRSSDHDPIVIGLNLRSNTKTVRNDFGNDQKSDILWRNSSGEVYTYQMNGFNVASEGSLGIVSNDWKIAGTGDFNGDSKTDILWRNDNGLTLAWQMNSNTKIGEGIIRSVSSDWKIAGTGDFNGDGKSDIIWRNTNSGLTYIYQMDGYGVASEGVVNNSAVNTLGSDWNIAGTGDFNGDGKSDILWRNANTGSAHVYLMNGLLIADQGEVRQVSNDWAIEGVDDFNNDGKSDILWRNVNGSAYTYQMNGLQVASEGIVGAAGADWDIIGTGDYNGDAKADILWRNNNGLTLGWAMDGLNQLAQGSLRQIDNSWQIAAPIL